MDEVRLGRLLDRHLLSANEDRARSFVHRHDCKDQRIKIDNRVSRLTKGQVILSTFQGIRGFRKRSFTEINNHMSFTKESIVAEKTSLVMNAHAQFHFITEKTTGSYIGLISIKIGILTRDVILPWFQAVLECGHIGLGEDFSFDLRILFRARIGWRGRGLEVRGHVEIGRGLVDKGEGLLSKFDVR